MAQAKSQGLDADLDRAVPAETAAAFLLAINGSQPGRVFALHRNTTVIGRSEEVDIRIADPSISSEHARIINGSLGFEIQDLGSTNGTFVGADRVQRAQLRAGDRVTLGAVEFAFLMDRALDATMALMAPGARASNGSVLAPRLLPAMPASAPRTLSTFVAEQEGPSPAEMIRRLVLAYRFLRRYARLILVLGAMGGLAGSVSAIVVPPAPMAISEVKLHPAKKSNPVENAWRPPDESALQFFAEAERSFTHGPLLAATFQKLHGQTPADDQLEGLQDRLRLELIGDHRYRASYRQALLERSPVTAVQLLEAHLDNYLQTEIQKTLRVLTEEAQFLDRKLQAAQNQLSNINGELAQFKRENADSLPETALLASTSRFELQTRKGELHARVARLEGEVAVDRRQLQAEGPLMQSRLAASQGYRDSLSALNRRLSEAYAKGLADGHPEVRQILDEKSRLERLIDQEMRSPTSDLDRSANAGYSGLQTRVEMSGAQLHAARSELREVERSLTRLQTMTGKTPAVAARLDDLQRSHEATKRLHDQLFDQVQKANLQLEIERLAARSRYEIVIPPSLRQPKRPVAVALRTGMGLALALALAAAIIALREGRRLVARTLASIEEARL
jgi:pSer/pThr/pTyr-binding forkhead associated (FHA) protein/uncharacterized protein involved in exopolysaccharide biosynthesis